jgi:hypothetical protein
METQISNSENSITYYKPYSSFQRIHKIVENEIIRKEYEYDENTTIDDITYFIDNIHKQNISKREYETDMEVLNLFNEELINITNNMVKSGELIKPASTKGYYKLKDTNKNGSLAMYEANDYVFSKIIELGSAVIDICSKYKIFRTGTGHFHTITLKKSFLDIRHRKNKKDIFEDYVDEYKIRRPEYMNLILKKYYYLKFNGKF